MKALQLSFKVLKEDAALLKACAESWTAAAMSLVNAAKAALGEIKSFAQLDDLSREAMVMFVAPNGAKHVYRKAFSGPFKTKNGFTGKTSCRMTLVSTVKTDGDVKYYDITASSAAGYDMSYMTETKFLQLQEQGWKAYAYRTAFGVRAKEREEAKENQPPV